MPPTLTVLPGLQSLTLVDDAEVAVHQLQHLSTLTSLSVLGQLTLVGSLSQLRLELPGLIITHQYGLFEVDDNHHRYYWRW